MRSALRSTTFAYLLAPNLCIPLFVDDVEPVLFWSWYAIAMGLGLFRIAVSFGPESARQPQRTLRLLTAAVAGIGLVWGAGWLLLVPELNQENRYIYLYIVTGTMFSAMFGYGVHRPAFLAVAVPTLAPAPFALFWPNSGFPWPFSVGILGLMVTVYGISRRFEHTFFETMRLRFENQRIAEQLVRERDVSIAANLAKSEFIATASHDLRQPMFAINLHLQSLTHETLEAPVRRTILRIRNSVTKLNAMFNELLDLSRADAGVIEPQLADLDLVKTLAEVCANTRIQCAAKGLDFKAELAGIAVRSDPILLAQIVQNLLTNAVQNTEAGSVAVNAVRKNGHVDLVIADTGRGIPEAHRERMFDEFFRVPRAGDEAPEPALAGLGLGLAIVRRLSGLLGIALSVDSTVGEGTQFTLRIPAAERTADTGHRAGARETVDLAGTSILVIDDDPLVRSAYAAALGSEGMRVIESDGSDLAAGLTPEGDFDLVIADFKLGAAGTGDMAIRRLRAERGTDLPAIIVTADTAPDHLTVLRQTGIPVLFKPVGYAQLRQAIEDALRRPKRPSAPAEGE